MLFKFLIICLLILAIFLVVAGGLWLLAPKKLKKIEHEAIDLTNEDELQTLRGQLETALAKEKNLKESKELQDRLDKVNASIANLTKKA